MEKLYKVFNEDMCSRGFCYEIGKEASMDPGDVRMCKVGFHACRSIVDCFEWFSSYSDSEAIYEVMGEVVEEGNKKVVCNRLIPVQKVSKEGVGAALSDSNFLTDFPVGAISKIFHNELVTEEFVLDVFGNEELRKKRQAQNFFIGAYKKQYLDGEQILEYSSKFISFIDQPFLDVLIEYGRTKEVVEFGVKHGGLLCRLVHNSFYCENYPDEVFRLTDVSPYRGEELIRSISQSAEMIALMAKADIEVRKVFAKRTDLTEESLLMLLKDRSQDIVERTLRDKMLTGKCFDYIFKVLSDNFHKKGKRWRIFKKFGCNREVTPEVFKKFYSAFGRELYDDRDILFVVGAPVEMKMRYLHKRLINPNHYWMSISLSDLRSDELVDAIIEECDVDDLFRKNYGSIVAKSERLPLEKLIKWNGKDSGRFYESLEGRAVIKKLVFENGEEYTLYTKDINRPHD